MMPVPEPKCLTDGRSLAARLQHQPLIHLALFEDALRPKCIFRIVHLDKINENSRTFPNNMIVLSVVD